jgi:RNA polymerase sigma-70 factor (ECF subfamily)
MSSLGDAERETDSRLVRRARAGDKGAFASLAERHRRVLVAACRSVSGDHEVAQDLAQEAILQAMLNLDRLRDRRRFRSWLIAIGLHTWRRWQRQTGRLRSSEVLPLQASDLSAGPDEVASERELADRIRAAVADLPAGQRNAVLAFYLAGLTYQETADLLGVQLGAVKTRLHKAREALKGKLYEVWREEHMVTGTNGKLVDVEVAAVRRRKPDPDRPSYHMVVLSEAKGDRSLAIWVGPAEGTAIAIHAEKLETERPLTFGFISQLLSAADAGVKEVQINKLVGDTFYSRVILKRRTGERAVDARPSDAIALALTVGAPIRVEAGIFEAAESNRSERGFQEDAWHGEGSLGTKEIIEEVKAMWARRREEPEGSVSPLPPRSA